MTLQQTHYRFRTDGDAADATPSWGADEDTGFDPGGDPFRLRFGVANVGNAISDQFQIYVQKNAGAFAAVTTSSTDGLKSYDASSDADDTAILVPRMTMSVEWWLADAAIDLDFAGDRIYPSGAFTDYLSCSRASDGYAQNAAGDWVQFSSNVLRITDLGLLIEDGGTNYLINSAAPATQETDSLGTGDYTLWVEGTGSAIASNGTGTITGAESATEGSPSVFTVTGAGTVNVTVTGSLDRFQLENGGLASSFIATGAVSAARAADVVTCIGSMATILTSAPQTIFADVIINSIVSGYRNYVGIVAAHPDNDTLLQRDGGGNAVNKVLMIEANADGAAALSATFGGSKTWLTGVKIASCQDGSARSLVGGGGTVATDGGHSVSSGPYYLGGYNYFDTNLYGNLGGYVRRLTVWNSRLADATLQSLTAP